MVKTEQCYDKNTGIIKIIIVRNKQISRDRIDFKTNNKSRKHSFIHSCTLFT